MFKIILLNVLSENVKKNINTKHNKYIELYNLKLIIK